ncbi:hypothetical protein HDU97_009989 [Phlyctochytrium planicorne]|nr:hypothetical protein HDU97_009989 [Phlyctochytrium planicorne]
MDGLANHQKKNFTALGLVTLVTRDVYSAVGVRDFRLAGLSASQDYLFGFFEVCTFPTPGADPPDITIPGQINTEMVCMTYAKACGDVRFQTVYDPGPFIDPEFCGSKWKTAVVLQVIAAIIGTLVVLLLIDNALVWLNRSCWYHPKRHLVSEVDMVRRTFKVIVILFVLAHGSLQAFAMGILFDLQRHHIKWPTSLDFHWGIFLQGISWVGDIIFILLFLFFDRLTFFVNVDWDFEDDESSVPSTPSNTAPQPLGSGLTQLESGTNAAAVAIISGAPDPRKKKGKKSASSASDGGHQPFAVHVGSGMMQGNGGGEDVDDLEAGAGNVLKRIGGSRIDAVAVQMIRGEKG